MAISIQYSPDPRLIAEAARLAGQGQFAQERDRFRIGADQFALNLGQRQSEFDQQLAQRQFEYGNNYGLQAAQFAYGQYDDTRKFGEGVRQYDQTFGEGVRRFDLGYDLDRDRFGEQQRQADIGNQFNQVQFQDRQAQFGAQLGLSYDQMAQRDYLQQQEMAFQAQQAQLARADNAQRQMQGLRFSALQEAEQQRQQQIAAQSQAEWTGIQKAVQTGHIRTQEQYDQAVGQWNDRFSALSTPPPIDLGFQQRPTLQDRLVNVGGVQWLMDENGEPMQPIDPRLNMDFQRELEQMKNQQNEEKMRQQMELGQQKLSQQEQAFQLKTQDTEHDNQMAAHSRNIDLWSQQSRMILKQREAERKLAEMEAKSLAGSDVVGAEVVPRAPDFQALRKKYDEIEARYPLPPMPQFGGGQGEQQQGYSGPTTEIGGGQGEQQQGYSGPTTESGIPAPQNMQQYESLPPGMPYMAPDGTVRTKR